MRKDKYYTAKKITIEVYENHDPDFQQETTFFANILVGEKRYRSISGIGLLDCIREAIKVIKTYENIIEIDPSDPKYRPIPGKFYKLGGDSDDWKPGFNSFWVSVMADEGGEYGVSDSAKCDIIEYIDNLLEREKAKRQKDKEAVIQLVDQHKTSLHFVGQRPEMVIPKNKFLKALTDIYDGEEE